MSELDPKAPAEVQEAVREMLAAAEAHRRARRKRTYSPLAGKGDAPKFSKISTAVAVALRRRR